MAIKREPNSIPRPFFPLLYYLPKALTNFSSPRLALPTSPSFHKHPPPAFQASPLPINPHACHNACPLSPYHRSSFRSGKSTSEPTFPSSISLYSRGHLAATTRLERQYLSRSFFNVWQLRWQHWWRLGQLAWRRLRHRPGGVDERSPEQCSRSIAP